MYNWLESEYGIVRANLPDGFVLAIEQSKFYSFALEFLQEYGVEYSDDAEYLEEEQFSRAFRRSVSGGDNYFKID